MMIRSLVSSLLGALLGALLASPAYADTITLDSGARLEGDLARFEFGGDCQISVTEGDLLGVIVILPCQRIASFVRTSPRLVVPSAGPAAPSLLPSEPSPVATPAMVSVAPTSGEGAASAPIAAGLPPAVQKSAAPVPASPDAQEPPRAEAPGPLFADPVSEAVPAPGPVPTTTPTAAAGGGASSSPGASTGRSTAPRKDTLAEDAPQARVPTVIEQLLGASPFDDEPDAESPEEDPVSARSTGVGAAEALPAPSVVAHGPQPVKSISPQSTSPLNQPRPAPSMDAAPGAAAAAVNDAASGAAADPSTVPPAEPAEGAPAEEAPAEGATRSVRF